MDRIPCAVGPSQGVAAGAARVPSFASLGACPAVRGLLDLAFHLILQRTGRKLSQGPDWSRFPAEEAGGKCGSTARLELQAHSTAAVQWVPPIPRTRSSGIHGRSSGLREVFTGRFPNLDLVLPKPRGRRESHFDPLSMRQRKYNGVPKFVDLNRLSSIASIVQDRTPCSTKLATKRSLNSDFHTIVATHFANLVWLCHR